MEDRGLFDFDELYNEFSKLVFHIANDKVKDFHVAEDIVQEVFLKLDKKLYLIQSKEHAKAWLIRVTSNMCVDYLRKHSPENRQSLEENDHPGLSEDMIEKSIEFWDAQKRIDSVLEKLYKKNKRWYIITVEAYLGNKSNRELAERFHVSLNTISSLQYRTRKWLSKELLDQNQDLKYIYDKIFEERETAQKDVDKLDN